METTEVFMNDPIIRILSLHQQSLLSFKKLISTVNCNARFQFIDSFKLNDKCGHKISWFSSLINFIGYEKTWQIKWGSILLLQAIFFHARTYRIFLPLFLQCFQHYLPKQGCSRKIWEKNLNNKMHFDLWK